MTEFDAAKARAFNYLKELRETAEIRQIFNDILVGRNGELLGLFAYDREIKDRIRGAANLKTTSTTVMYKGLFIQSHSVFESYVRDLSRIVLRKRSEAAANYFELPEDLRLNHIHYSAGVLRQIKSGTVSGQRFDFDGLIRALGNCFSGSEIFSIVPEVFTLMMGNASPDRLENLFRELGLEDPFNPGIGRNAHIKKVLNESRQAPAARLAKKELKRLLDLRNTLVHGDFSASVEKSDFDDAVNFFEAVIEGLHEIVLSDVE